MVSSYFVIQKYNFQFLASTASFSNQQFVSIFTTETTLRSARSTKAITSLMPNTGHTWKLARKSNLFDQDIIESIYLFGQL